MADYRNILIIKPSAIGDIVHTLPALGSLRKSFPRAKVTWLIRKQFASLLECVPGVDERILFDRKQLGRWWCSRQSFEELRRFLADLRGRHFDIVFDFQGLFRTAFFAWQTRSSRRYGMAEAREFSSLFYTHRVSRPEQSYHVLDYYNAMVAAAGGTEFSTQGTLAAPESACVALRQRFSELGILDKPYAVLIPGSAHQSKCWPVERFSRLAERLTREMGFTVLVAGSESERTLADTLAKGACVPVLNFAGQTTICQLVGLLGGAKLVVSNDTGPGHIAEGMGVPTVLIFGHTNPLRVGPYGRAQSVAAIEPCARGGAIENSDPRYHIENVSESLVWDKVAMAMARGGRNED